MTERRSARWWIGCLAVAGIAVLAVGPWLYRRLADNNAIGSNGDAVAQHKGEDAHTEHPLAAEQPQARALIAKSYEAALRSPHRLEWAPEEVRPSNVVFDLCDDAQAKMAGLAFNALDYDRSSLGVNCQTFERRFAYVPPNEAMRLADSYEEAEALLRELAEKGSIKGEPFNKPVGMLMGHRGPLAVDMEPCGNGFGCARATMDVGHGATRGMFANVSTQVAHNVAIRAGHVVARHPLSVQPGENTAFEIPAELTPAELATLTITATFVDSADPRRAVLLMGAPGDITGPRDELAKRFYGIDPLRDPPELTYFSEVLMLENSTTHPAAAQTLPGKVLDSPTAVVALLDENQKVVQVLRPPITSDNDGAKHTPITTMAWAGTYTIGFVVPPGIAQYAISVGGAE